MLREQLIHPVAQSIMLRADLEDFHFSESKRTFKISFFSCQANPMQTMNTLQNLLNPTIYASFMNLKI